MPVSKKSRSRINKSTQRRFPWPGLAIAIAAVLVIGAGLVVWSSSNRRPEAPPQVAGSPKLAVDQTIVDEGYVQFNVPVRSTFRLSNVGDQPLEIVEAPVELVEGC
jgi:hypothetical protein